MASKLIAGSGLQEANLRGSRENLRALLQCERSSE